MIWIYLLIPLLGLYQASKAFPKDMDIGKIGLTFVACVVSLFGTNAYMSKMACRSVEYWGGYLTRASYFEPWDEEVPCRHTQWCTSTDSKGRSYSYACGREHSYDVQYHPAEWWMYNSNEESWAIDQGQFDALCMCWGNKTFEGLHHHYHSINGDRYNTLWDAKFEHIHPTVTEHYYENRIANSDSSVLRARDISVEERAQLALFEYPKTRFFTTAVLGYTHPATADFDRQLCLIAQKKQVRVWVLCFKNQPLQAGVSQEDYWKRGNKNELVVCVGLDNSGVIQWAHDFSWTEREDLKIEVRQWLEDRKGKALDIKELSDFLIPELKSKWERKHFKEFDYITVTLPWWGHAGIAGATLLCLGLCLFFSIDNPGRQAVFEILAALARARFG